jgi:hypothetical protein
MSTPPPLLSEGEIGLSSTATKDVLEHHGAAVLSGDIDAVMEDYTDDSVFISNIGGVLRGVNAIRPVFEMGRDYSSFQGTTQYIEGEVAYATWTAEGVGFGTDTFIIRDGKIVVQTVAIFLVE